MMTDTKKQDGSDSLYELVGPAEIIQDLADKLEGAKEVIEALSEMYGFSVGDNGLTESIARARELIDPPNTPAQPRGE